ncbi:SMP-30/gluconolactonase/LRE family protein [Allomuricauda sp.]|uniref:SMP-30/gluconolactonase/LRE family protein n=1 Tax=Flagellimonas sp. TaxID=2058762 RepID=UPI001B17D39F|nr:SMP-30/gluconolactonase/LRE family protein [Allomuricauda sp.]MBO6830984.1 SMP-30/gluconolactonase/LRE family protein [Allomuricauda sp.]
MKNSTSLIIYPDSELLEGPIFDKENNLLYFVSIFDGLVYCYNQRTKEILSVRLDSPTSCVYLLEEKQVMAASKNGFFKIDFNTLDKQFAFNIDIAPYVRYNDGIEDALGRYIIGTMGYPEVKKNVGTVYSYYNGTYQTLIQNTTISNGLAFSKDNSLLYFIDTPTKKVAKYYYDLQTGKVSFDSYIIELKGEGSPDGMCMDEDGMLWIAEWGGGCVSKWDPFTGKKIGVQKIPCTNVTSCCFDNNSNLYVTTAKSDSTEDIYGGGLFYVELNKT